MTNFSRRRVLTLLAASAAAPLMPRIAFAQAAGPFKLDPLPYANNALEPSIDARTMEIHYGRHHMAFITNLNNFAKDNPQITQRPPEEILGNLSSVPDAIRTGVRNSMGGHANHTMFWQIMGPNGGKPEGELAAAITSDLGGLQKMQDDFNAAGGRVFGSGWVFVTVTRDGKLAIESKPNQDTPLMYGKRVLFGNDVW